jgi:uncharacterized protein with FMN-binding domain
VIGPAFAAQAEVRRIEIQNIDLDNLADGVYTGSFTYSITGATTSSKAILKALEIALSRGEVRLSKIRFQDFG